MPTASARPEPMRGAACKRRQAPAGGTMTRLTRRQRELLAALRAHDRRQGVTAPDLARIVGGSPQGIHRTAASLARKGLVAKLRHHGWVFLRITPAGATRLSIPAARRTGPPAIDRPGRPAWLYGSGCCRNW